ncbi:unnamed protein product [Closterium sp. Naga37s-1]|nr:unnamed protein product [Closterium sp. Naga37s-1]CAI5519031.1 unnamed protein product [Closterium sp. Naga37s-1]
MNRRPTPQQPRQEHGTSLAARTSPLPPLSPTAAAVAAASGARHESLLGKRTREELHEGLQEKWAAFGKDGVMLGDSGAESAAAAAAAAAVAGAMDEAPDSFVGTDSSRSPSPPSHFSAPLPPPPLSLPSFRSPFLSHFASTLPPALPLSSPLSPTPTSLPLPYSLSLPPFLPLPLPFSPTLGPLPPLSVSPPLSRRFPTPAPPCAARTTSNYCWTPLGRPPPLSPSPTSPTRSSLPSSTAAAITAARASASIWGVGGREGGGVVGGAQHFTEAQAAGSGGELERSGQAGEGFGEAGVVGGDGDVARSIAGMAAEVMIRAAGPGTVGGEGAGAACGATARRGDAGGTGKGGAMQMGRAGAAGRSEGVCVGRGVGGGGESGGAGAGGGSTGGAGGVGGVGAGATKGARGAGAGSVKPVLNFAQFSRPLQQYGSAHVRTLRAAISRTNTRLTPLPSAPATAAASATTVAASRVAAAAAACGAGGAAASNNAAAQVERHSTAQLPDASIPYSSRSSSRPSSLPSSRSSARTGPSSFPSMPPPTKPASPAALSLPTSSPTRPLTHTPSPTPSPAHAPSVPSPLAPHPPTRVSSPGQMLQGGGRYVLASASPTAVRRFSSFAADTATQSLPFSLPFHFPGADLGLGAESGGEEGGLVGEEGAGQSRVMGGGGKEGGAEEGKKTQRDAEQLMQLYEQYRGREGQAGERRTEGGGWRGGRAGEPGEKGVGERGASVGSGAVASTRESRTEKEWKEQQVGWKADGEMRTEGGLDEGNDVRDEDKGVGAGKREEGRKESRGDGEREEGGSWRWGGEGSGGEEEEEGDDDEGFGEEEGREEEEGDGEAERERREREGCMVAAQGCLERALAGSERGVLHSPGPAILGAGRWQLQAPARRRRDKINERFNAMRELLPDCSKADKASLLDKFIEHIKAMQLQLQVSSLPSLLLPPIFSPSPHHPTPPPLRTIHAAASPPHPLHAPHPLIWHQSSALLFRRLGAGVTGAAAAHVIAPLVELSPTAVTTATTATAAAAAAAAAAGMQQMQSSPELHHPPFPFLMLSLLRLCHRDMAKVARILRESRGEGHEERLGERRGDRHGERLGERRGERLGERRGERLGERRGERLGERLGEGNNRRLGEERGTRAGALGSTAGAAGATGAIGGTVSGATAGGDGVVGADGGAGWDLAAMEAAALQVARMEQAGRGEAAPLFPHSHSNPGRTRGGERRGQQHGHNGGLSGCWMEWEQELGGGGEESRRRAGGELEVAWHELEGGVGVAAPGMGDLLVMGAQSASEAAEAAAEAAAAGIGNNGMWVSALTYCPHVLSADADAALLPPHSVPPFDSLCHSCKDGSENWVCLTCGVVACGRYVGGHMLQHVTETAHPLAAGFRCAPPLLCAPHEASLPLPCPSSPPLDLLLAYPVALMSYVGPLIGLCSGFSFQRSVQFL